MSGVRKNNKDGVDVDILFLGVWKNNRDVDKTLSKKFKPSSPHILDF